MKVHFLKGWITPQTMQETGWLESWKESAAAAEKENCDLVVFKIPKGGNLFSDVGAVEKFLQEKYREFIY